MTLTCPVCDVSDPEAMCDVDCPARAPVDSDGQPHYPEPVRLRRDAFGYTTHDTRFQVVKDHRPRSWLIFDTCDEELEDTGEPVYVVASLAEARRWLAGHYVPSA